MRLSRRPPPVRGLFLAAAVGTIAACAEPTRVEEGDETQPILQARASSMAASLLDAARAGDTRRGFESRILRMEADAAGIGGVFYDPEHRRAVVRVVPGADAARALAVARSSLAGKRMSTSDRSGLVGPPVIVWPAEYSFSQLVAWMELLAPRVAAVPGWSAIDADERSNRVSIGITNETARSSVVTLALASGVPLEAIEVEVIGAAESLSKLTDRIRPVGAGLQIQNDQFLEAETCTAGWPVEYNGAWGFLTASHCSKHSLGSAHTGEKMYQKQKTASDFIGHVGENPDWDASNCEDEEGEPWTSTCTDADVMWVTTSDLSSIDQEIALTDTLNVNNDERGGISGVDWYRPSTDSLGGATAGFMVGETAYKVGRTTGYTGGEIDATCVYRKIDQSFVMKCSTVVTGSAVGKGDSGAPVFGLVWGGDPIPFGIVVAGEPLEDTDSEGFDYCENPTTQSTCTMVFAPVESIETHFGHSFDYSGGRPIEVEILGPSAVQPSAQCTWQAMIDGGTGNVSYSWSGILSGSGSSISGTPSGSGYLSVSVTDANSKQDTDSFYVVVTSSADECVE